ncbi:MAG TPA: cytochrome P450 [Steroidobacteraceae bacterium]|jgi:cytochrome P450|nr:cytochrome P450 [Steroidobacteraceae bacterium]
MTTLDNPVAAPVLPAPVPPQRHLTFFEFVRALRQSAIDSFAQEAYEQDIVQRRIFGRSLFVVNDPAAIKHVLIDNAANYQKTEITRRILEPGLGKGLITSEGETWRQHRRIMSPSFDHRSTAAYVPVMTGAAVELSTQWEQTPAGTAIDASTAMMQVTLNIISRTMFSNDSDDIVTIMSRSAGRYQAEMRPNIMDMLGWPKWLAGLPRRRVAERTLGEFDHVIDRLIEERVRDPEAYPKDLLARLVAARDEQTGVGMSAQEVRDHVITIFLAGHETTAMAMTWTWFLLSQHPDVETKLHAELGAVLGGRAPAHEDLSALTYTRMVIEESMRIYPPVHTIARQALDADILVGRHIPKGSTVMIAPWLLHRHVKLWDNPSVFDPERFSPERSAGRVRFSYMPFGGGKRICIGAAFSLAEATILLATLAQRFSLRLAPGHRVEPQGLITLRARYGMKMLLSRRS